MNAARNGAIIHLMPGVYQEEPSRAIPIPTRVARTTTRRSALAARLRRGRPGRRAKVATYEYQCNCPNAQNLIAIIGDDPDEDRVCDNKCNLQIEGMGRTRADVLISGQRTKLNVIRADRADGIYLKNFTVEFSDFNNIYVLETNGFRMEDIHRATRASTASCRSPPTTASTTDSRRSAPATPASTPAQAPRATASATGSRSATRTRTTTRSATPARPATACGRTTTFHHNSTGMTTDSFASGHPGMPQDCAKWESNEIYSNNEDYFNAERDAYCKNTPPSERDPTIVCPTFQVPVGTGIGIFGGNGNIVRDNYIYDNWRDGVKLLFVPAAFRGEPDKAIDTSFDNTFADNRWACGPTACATRTATTSGGTRRARQLLERQRRAGRRTPSSNVLTGLPACPGSTVFSPGVPIKTASQATCSTWDPYENPDPPGCDWFTRPEEPR